MTENAHRTALACFHRTEEPGRQAYPSIFWKYLCLILRPFFVQLAKTEDDTYAQVAN
jgi:hypothetical protein